MSGLCILIIKSYGHRYRPQYTRSLDLHHMIPTRFKISSGSFDVLPLATMTKFRSDSRRLNHTPAVYEDRLPTFQNLYPTYTPPHPHQHQLYPHQCTIPSSYHIKWLLHQDPPATSKVGTHCHRISSTLNDMSR